MKKQKPTHIQTELCLKHQHVVNVLNNKNTFLFYKLFVEEQKKIHILKKGILAFTSPSCGCGALSDGHGRLRQTEPGVFRHQEEEMQEMCGGFFCCCSRES